MSERAGRRIALIQQATKIGLGLQKAGFSDRLARMPKGLDTCLYKDLDEDGVTISGGEAQKIALAHQAKAGVGGGDQIGGCVGQRAVKVKDYGSQGLAALLLRLCLKFAEKVCDPFSLAADPSIGKTGAS